MNLLSIIFSILIALSITFCALFEKQIGGARLRSSYIGHMQANRAILQSYEKEVYKNLPGKSPVEKPEKDPSQICEEKDPPFPPVNPPCARLNLWPLVQEGKEAHPLLYQTAAKLLQTFYGKPLLNDKPGLASVFLDEFLHSLRTQKLPLEKLPFSHPLHQKLYYQMLKGTKECDLFQHIGYPSLLEYFSFDPAPSKPCLFHAHPYLTAALFNPEIALKLHRTIHKRNGDPLSCKLIQQLCSEAHLFLNPELLDLVEAKSCRSPAPTTTFTATDSDTKISLKKTIPIEKKTPSS